jgi:hypothetical protein
VEMENLTARKSDTVNPMLRMRTFGISCPECHQFVPAGVVEIQETAAPSELHSKLRELGWQAQTVTCENLECGSKTICEPDKTFLGVSGGA